MEETTEQRNKPKGRMPRNAKVPPSRSGKVASKAGREEDVYDVDEDCIIEETAEHMNNTEG